VRASAAPGDGQALGLAAAVDHRSLLGMLKVITFCVKFTEVMRTSIHTHVEVVSLEQALPSLTNVDRRRHHRE